MLIVWVTMSDGLVQNSASQGVTRSRARRGSSGPPGKKARYAGRHSAWILARSRTTSARPEIET